MKRRLKLIVSVVYFALRSAMEALCRVVGRPRPPRLVILCYHAVPEAKARMFAAQMDEVARFERAIATVDCSRLTGHAVAVTFDDAFESVKAHALPILSERGLQAVVFVPAGLLGSRPSWAFDGESSDQRETIMSTPVLRGLDADRVLLGSHTLTHPRLTALAPADLEREVAGSRRFLEQALGRPVTSIAFPHGAHDSRVVDACRAAGYQHLFSVTPTPVSKSSNAPVRGRVTVEPDDPSMEFYLKVRGAYAWMAWASAIKARAGLRVGPEPTPRTAST